MKKTRKIDPYDVIISPVITEKSTMASEFNKVVFNVRRDATKPIIKSAVEELFNVKVKSVNTLVRKGKLKQFRGRRALQSDVKKAIVTLEEGHSIDVTTGL
jgi:large subunit ribosomal protein L23|nr:MAG: 50S ribosomal protein L23 [Pseudomonadota bacterium]